MKIMHISWAAAIWSCYQKAVSLSCLLTEELLCYIYRHRNNTRLQKLQCSNMRRNVRTVLWVLITLPKLQFQSLKCSTIFLWSVLYCSKIKWNNITIVSLKINECIQHAECHSTTLRQYFKQFRYNTHRIWGTIKKEFLLTRSLKLNI